jgi:hypothetical protein
MIESPRHDIKRLRDYLLLFFSNAFASFFSLDHRSVNLAAIIAPMIIAQIHSGALSTIFQWR